MQPPSRRAKSARHMGSIPKRYLWASVSVNYYRAGQLSFAAKSTETVCRILFVRLSSAYSLCRRPFSTVTSLAVPGSIPALMLACLWQLREVLGLRPRHVVICTGFSSAPVHWKQTKRAKEQTHAHPIPRRTQNTSPTAYWPTISKITPRQAPTLHAETLENASASALKLCKNGTNKPKSMLTTLPAPPPIWQQKNRRLNKENAELKRTNKILRTASAIFAAEIEASAQ